MSSEQVDLTKINNDAELLAHAPGVIATKTKSFFFRYQEFIYGFLAGAAVVCTSRLVRKSIF
jgi:hypothetical protein